MSKRELEKKVEEQHQQILLYEKKIKDLVRAYKSLEKEKNALQTVVETLGNSEAGESGEQGASIEGEQGETLASVKSALATLTKEKVRRETAFQNDKKALLVENESLKERLKKAADESELQADQMEKIVKELSQKVKRIEADRERELSDHGSVLAEMQQRYAKEKMSAESAHKQIVELYKKLQDKEGMPDQIKQKNLEHQNEVAALKREVAEWKEKAERTPTVQLLQDQLSNMKLEFERDLEEARRQAPIHALRGESETLSARIHHLESSLHSITETLSKSEREKLELADELKRNQDENNQLKEHIARLERMSPTFNGNESERSQKELMLKLMKSLQEKNVNVFEILGGDKRVDELRRKLDDLRDEYERYKIKAEAVLKVKSAPVENTEDAGLRALVGQLHEKLRQLEVAHSTDQAQYELTTRNLRCRISELERSEEQCRNEMKKEMQEKISEMEDEMQKQRSRTLDIVAEKERELEVTRSMLVSLRSEQLNGTGAPADPAQTAPAKIQHKRRSGDAKRYADRRISAGSRKSLDAISVSSVDHHHSFGGNDNIPFPVVNESRNIFYEEELAKKDKEIADMRSSFHQLEYRMRELEQSSLCKDLQNHEVSEALREEIRVLDGKLKLVTTDNSADIQYLRNIFVQYLTCTSSSGSKNILKAIAMVLKLSPNEMKAIDRK